MVDQEIDLIELMCQQIEEALIDHKEARDQLKQSLNTKDCEEPSLASELSEGTE